MNLNLGDEWPFGRDANVQNERKYHLVSTYPERKWSIMTYFNDRTTGREYQLHTRESHASITEDINLCCRKYGRPEGGVFYITEKKDVIKPIQTDDITRDIYVGRYPSLKLLFRLGEVDIDNSDDSDLLPGDVWPYQRVGIHYTYSAYKKTASFWKGTDFGRERISIPLHGELLENLKAFHPSGGGMYVNEHGVVFAPSETDVYTDVYIGKINDIDWFPYTN